MRAARRACPLHSGPDSGSGAAQPGLPLGFAQAGQHFQQFGLPVAGHPRDAQNFTRADGKADLAQAFHALRIDKPQPVHAQHLVTRLRLRFFHAQQYLAAYHQFRKLGRAGVGGFARGNDLSAPHHADLICYIHDFPQFVRDQDDRFALLFQPAQDAEQVVGL